MSHIDNILELKEAAAKRAIWKAQFEGFLAEAVRIAKKTGKFLKYCQEDLKAEMERGNP